MEVKKIVEGMTASEVAAVIEDNFNEVDKKKSDKTAVEKGLSDLHDKVNNEIKGLVVQETGDSENVVMSQKATSEKFSELEQRVGWIAELTTYVQKSETPPNLLSNLPLKKGQEVQITLSGDAEWSRMIVYGNTVSYVLVSNVVKGEVYTVTLESDVKDIYIFANEITKDGYVTIKVIPQSITTDIVKIKEEIVNVNNVVLETKDMIEYEKNNTISMSSGTNVVKVLSEMGLKNGDEIYLKLSGDAEWSRMVVYANNVSNKLIDNVVKDTTYTIKITSDVNTLYLWEGGITKNGSVSISVEKESLRTDMKRLESSINEARGMDYTGSVSSSENSIVIKDIFIPSGTEFYYKVTKSGGSPRVIINYNGTDNTKNRLADTNVELQFDVWYKTSISVDIKSFAIFALNNNENDRISLFVSDGKIGIGDLIRFETIENRIESEMVQPSEIGNTSNITDGGSLVLTNFPLHIKKRVSISCRMNVSAFGSVLIGKGYNDYRGKWIEVDSSNVTVYAYENSQIKGSSISHTLNIETFLGVVMTCKNDGSCDVIVSTMGGVFKHTFENWGYEFNGSPFVRSVGSNLSDVRLNADCADFSKDIWAFGDSYFGVTKNRWIGCFKDWGYFDFLINGLSGRVSSQAYSDFKKCLNHGTPRYVFWCLGMNDTFDSWSQYFEKVKTICEEKGIKLIAATIPSVPTRRKESITSYVRESGLKYVDFYNAVGANTEGVWYNGYLETEASENVHPTELGAKALAMRVLQDFPEIMNV